MTIVALPGGRRLALASLGITSEHYREGRPDRHNRGHVLAGAGALSLGGLIDGLKQPIWLRTRPPLSHLKDQRGDCVICGPLRAFCTTPGSSVRKWRGSCLSRVGRWLPSAREHVVQPLPLSQRERGLTSALLSYYGGGATSLAGAASAVANLDIAEINRFNSAHNFLAMLRVGLRRISRGGHSKPLLSGWYPLRRGHHVGHARTRRRSQAGPRERRCACFGAGGRHVFTVPADDRNISQYAAADRPTPCTPGQPPGPLRHLRRRPRTCSFAPISVEISKSQSRQAGSWLKSGAKASTPCSWPSVHSDR